MGGAGDAATGMGAPVAPVRAGRAARARCRRPRGPLASRALAFVQSRGPKFTLRPPPARLTADRVPCSRAPQPRSACSDTTRHARGQRHVHRRFAVPCRPSRRGPSACSRPTAALERALRRTSAQMRSPTSQLAPSPSLSSPFDPVVEHESSCRSPPPPGPRAHPFHSRNSTVPAAGPRHAAGVRRRSTCRGASSASCSVGRSASSRRTEPNPASSRGCYPSCAASCGHPQPPAWQPPPAAASAAG
jgi:hypothetical protein